jgi:hypothetical protein
MDRGCREKILTQTERLEYCAMGKGLDTVRRIFWLEKESSIENLREVTPAHNFSSHRMEKGKGKK